MATDGREMTYAEFLDWLDEGTHAEWVDGRVVLAGAPSLRHQQVRLFLLHLLDLFVQTRRLGVVLDAPFQMKTGPDLPGRSPDILFVAGEEMHRLHAHGLEGPAGLVVEVVTCASRETDRGEKLREYERGGVREYWVVDPERRQAEFHILDATGAYEIVLSGADGLYRSRVLEGLWLEVQWLWRDPLPTLLELLKTWGLMDADAGPIPSDDPAPSE